MTRYVLKQIENRAQWESFVTAQPCGHFLQTWGWGELKASVGWHPLRLALWDTVQQEIVAAAQVLRRTPAHLPVRLGHLAYIPRGPVLDWSRIVDEGQPLWQVFFSQFLAYTRRAGAIVLQIELPQDAATGPGRGAQASLDELGFRPVPPVQPARSILLDLTPDEESLLAHMKEKWRYNVRLAARKGVVVREARSEEDVRAWYSLLQVTGERDVFGIHTLDYYLRAWHIFAPRKQAQLFLAEHDGALLAGIFVGCTSRQAPYLFGASGNTQRQLMPNYLLQWEAIQWAKRQGAQSYDFWGIPASDDPHEAMAGVYRFKSGWGGEIVRFAGNYEHIFHPHLARIARSFL